jgi:hypothetical protein
MSVRSILLLIAVLFFLADAFWVNQSRVKLTPLGLALWAFTEAFVP